MKLALCVLLLAAIAHARVERVYPRRNLARATTSEREANGQPVHHIEHKPVVEAHGPEHNEHREVSHREEEFERRVDGEIRHEDQIDVRDEAKIEREDLSGAKRGRFQPRRNR